jgi:hypothetical protein
MATKDNLQYLQKRLGQINGPECALAFDLVGRALGEFERFDGDPIFAHDVFREVWDHVSRALDHGEAEGEDRVILEAIEAEMAGHVLDFQVQKGLLVANQEKTDA